MVLASLAPLHRLAPRLADVILPPLCLACARRVNDHGTLCSSCWAGAQFIEAPLCPLTGIPFPITPPPGTLSPAALMEPPPWNRARAVMQYTDIAVQLITALKYRHQRAGVSAYAGWMIRAGNKLLSDSDIIIPVPLHVSRLRRRGFNQAAELARAIARQTGLPLSLSALIRTRPTPSQIGLSRRARQRNMRGAFSVRAEHKQHLAGRAVVLVDDVVTSGATCAAATRALLRAKVRRVDVLSLARVVRDTDADV